MRVLRYTVRQLLGSPGYTAIAVVTLALGMGATTAFFSVLYGVVLAPPPFPDGHRLVSLVNARPETSGDGDRLSRAEVVDIAARQRSFSALGAASLGRMTLNADGGSFAERVKVSDVTPAVFTVLGVPAARGAPSPRPTPAGSGSPSSATGSGGRGSARPATPSAARCS